MSNTIEQQGGFFSYLWNNMVASVASRTVGTGMNDGQTTADEVAAIFASNLSKITTTVVGEAMLKNALKNGIGLENFAKQLPSNYAELTYLAMDKHSQTSALKVLSELNPIREDGKKFISQLNDMLNNQINQTNQKIQSFGLSAHTSPEDILNKIVGNTNFSNEVFDILGKVFNLSEAVRMAVQKVDTSDTESISNYTMNWITYFSQLPVHKSITETYPRLANGIADVIDGNAKSWFDKIPALSGKNLAAVAARGVILGIATDMTYKVSYAGAEWVFSTGFDRLFGKELYEMDWFVKFSDSVYSTIFQHLTGDNLNAVIAFNTMILGNFINQSGKSVVYDDTAVLFSSKEYQEMSFEKALDNYKTLYKAITGSDSADDITDAEAMIKHMQESYPIFKELRGKTMIIAQDFKSVKEYYDIALSDDKNATAYRFALKHLLPMVILDADYSQYNQNGELNLYSKDNPNGITQEYLEVRTQMLGYKLQYAKMDIDYDERLQVSGILPLPVVKGDHIYQDLDNQLKLDIDGVNPTDFGSHRYVFGGSGDDKAIGGILSDKLFGGMGNDVLNGMSGDDYLEGGIDFDTYHITDHDTIYDSDGDGRLIFGGKNLPSVFIEQSTGLWLAKDDKDNITHSAIKSGKDLIIASENNQHTATIKNFFDIASNDQGVITALSVNLATEDNKEHAQKNATTFLDIDSKTSAVVYVGNPKTKLHITGSDDHRGDLYFGHGFAQKITLYANAGNDTIYGGLQGDELYGGAGNDIIFGTSPMFDSNPTNAPANDHDTIVGGQGSDLLNGGVGEDTIYADDKDSHKIVRKRQLGIGR